MKYISTKDTCPRLLHNTCLGVAIKPSFIQSFDFKKLSLCKHCFKGCHLVPHQTLFNRNYLVLILGIQRCTILKYKFFVIKHQSKMERSFQIAASLIYICAIFNEKFSHFLLLIADCISQCSCNIPCFQINLSMIFEQRVEHIPEKKNIP